MRSPIGLAEIVAMVGIIIVFMVLKIILGRSGGGISRLSGAAALVIKEARINENGPLYVKIKGRKSGLIAWILSLLGIDATTTLEVYGDRMEFTEGSLYGRLIQMIPLSAVCNVITGYLKPFTYLIIALICIPLAIPTFGISLILTAVFGILYFLRKSVLISIIPNSGHGPAICFKRSVIENVNIEEGDAYRIIAIINALSLKQQAHNSGDVASAGVISNDTAVINQQNTSGILFCTNCGERFKAGESRCTHCGTVRE